MRTLNPPELSEDLQDALRLLCEILSPTKRLEDKLIGVVTLLETLFALGSHPKGAMSFVVGRLLACNLTELESQTFKWSSVYKSRCAIDHYLSSSKKKNGAAKLASACADGLSMAAACCLKVVSSGELKQASPADRFLKVLLSDKLWGIEKDSTDITEVKCESDLRDICLRYSVAYDVPYQKESVFLQSSAVLADAVDLLVTADKHIMSQDRAEQTLALSDLYLALRKLFSTNNPKQVPEYKIAMTYAKLFALNENARKEMFQDIEKKLRLANLREVFMITLRLLAKFLYHEKLCYAEDRMSVVIQSEGQWKDEM